MEQIQAQPDEAMASETPTLVKLKKRVRAGAWIALCIGYLYLLSFVFGILSLILSIVATTNLDAFISVTNVEDLLLFTIILAIPGVVSSLLLGLALVALSKRILVIKKGFTWKARDIIADVRIKEYVSYLTLFFTFVLLDEIVATFNARNFAIALISTLIAFILFVYLIRGFIAAKELLLMPEFMDKVETPVYKKSSKFWFGVMVAGVLMSYTPLLIRVIFKDRISVITSQLSEQSTKVVPLSEPTQY